jgi:CRISPR/Cas system Type II protein with McrA/HNH and RuvC-like nuclease domain
MMDFEYQDGLKDLQSPLSCTEDDQTKIARNFNIWHDSTWLEGIRKLLLKTKI